MKLRMSCKVRFPAADAAAKINTDVVSDIVPSEADTPRVINSVSKTAAADSVPSQRTEIEEINIDKPDISSPRESETVAVPFPENGGMMERVMPDDGWMQHVAQAQPDDIEIDDDNNNAPAEMERFRVIAGGKEAAVSLPETAAERPANQPSPNVMAPLPDAPGDPKEVVLRKILRLVLAFHRSPRSFPGLDDPSQSLPKGIKAILELAIAEDQVLLGLRQIAVMGISPAMLRAAVRFFVRRVLFLPGGDDFRVLGLAPDASLTEVEAHYGLLMKLLRQDKKLNDESGVSRVGAAYECLCRSEITARPEEIAKPSSDVEDLEEELDLDLSPNMGRATNSGLRPPPANANEMIAEGTRTAPTVRNMMLIAGVAVIVFVLWLTQIKMTRDAEPEMAAGLPSAPVVVAEPVTKPAVAPVVEPLANEVNSDEDRSDIRNGTGSSGSFVIKCC